MKIRNIVLLGVAAWSLVGCANSSLLVEQPYAGSFRTTSATIIANTSTVTVDQENLDYTQRELEAAFFGGDEPIFTRGGGMTVRYRYLGFDEGSQALRYLTGPIAGGSKVVLEVEFVSPSGEFLSSVRGEGTVSGGIFGGSNKSGIDKAIEEIADYAAERFKG